MTAEQLNELIAACNTATPGPWAYRPKKNDDWGVVRGGDGMPVVETAPPCRWDLADCGKPEGPSPIPENGRFCVAARNLVPELIKAYRAALEREEKVREAIYAHQEVGNFSIDEDELDAANRELWTKVGAAIGLHGETR